MDKERVTVMGRYCCFYRKFSVGAYLRIYERIAERVTNDGFYYFNNDKLFDDHMGSGCYSRVIR